MSQELDDGISVYTDYELLIDKSIARNVLFPNGVPGSGGASLGENFISVSAYGVIGDGSDESALLQAAADAAIALAAGTLGNGQDARVLLYIPPGLRISISTDIIIPSHLVDIEMSGSVIVGGMLSVGLPGRGIYGGRFKGIHVRRDYTPDPWLSQEIAGFRLYNPIACDIDVYHGEGFRYGVEFRAEFGGTPVDGWYIAYNKVIIRDIRQAKYHLHLVNVDAPGGNGAWCNANEFHLGNIQNSVHGAGTIAGVCIESLNDDDESRYASNNIFHDPVFQLGSASEPAWTSGAVVSSGNVGRCYQSGMYSYRLVTAGTNGTTALDTIARNPGDSVTSGTAVYECEGFMLRVPFLLINACTLLTIHDPYSETGRGPFVHSIGPYVGNGHIVYNGTLQQDNPYSGQTGNPEWFDELQCETPTGTEVTSGRGYRYAPSFGRYINLQGEQYENEGMQDTRIDTGDFSVSAIMGANGWNSTELVWVTWTGSAPSYSGEALNNGTETDIRLGDGYLLASPNSWKTHMGLLVDCSSFKLLKVTCRSDSTYPAIGLLPLDSSGTLITIGTGTSVEGNDIAVTRASIDYRYFYNTSGTHRETWIKVSENVDKLIIVPAYGAGTGGGADSTAFRWNRFTVEGFPNKFKRYKQFKLLSPFYGNSTVRVSKGTPIAGYFPRLGEIIQNSQVSGGINEAIGWQVNTAGILASAWTTGTAVYYKELRSNGGRVYSAGADGTTGATAPTGTTTASDGTITWTYKGVEAVLAPIYKGISADEQLLLDYDYTQHNCKWWLDVDTTPADGYLDEVDGAHGPVKKAVSPGHESAVTVTDTVATKMQSRDLVWTTIDADWYSHLQYPISYTPGHVLFVAYELDNIDLHGANGYFLTRFDEISGIQQYLLDKYIPPDMPQNYESIPSGTTSFEIAYRIPTLASGGGIPFNWVQLNLVSLATSLPKRTEFRVKRIQIIDVNAASTALGIDITGYSAAELYSLMNTSLTAVPPTELKLTDSTTAATRTITVDSGALEIDGSPVTGGVAWGGITGTLSSQTDLNSALGGKADTSHTQALSTLTQSGATSGQVATWNGSAWTPVTPSGSGAVLWGGITGTLSDQTDLNSALSGKEASITAGTTSQYWRGDKSWQTLNATSVGLANVENTALSTWAGTANVITLGTIGTGTWNATAIADGKIASALTGKTYNGLSLTANATGWSLAGGTTSKTLTLSNTLTLAGTDASTLNIGAGGTLGSAAFTASTAYAAASHTHAVGDLTQSGATTNQVIKWNGTVWAPAADSSGGGVTSTTWASIPAANSVTAYTDTYHVTDIGIGGSRWFSDGTNWYPTNGCVLIKRITADITDDGQTAESVQDQVLIPAGLLRAGMRFKIDFRAVKADTTATHAWKLRMGTAGTTSDTAIYSPSSMTAGNKQNQSYWEFVVASATSIQSVTPNSSSTSLAGGTGQNSTADASAVTISNVSNALYLTLTAATQTATNPATIKLWDVLLCT